jgi:hypothetical protein
MWPLATECRTGSGSDLVVYEMLNYAQLKMMFDLLRKEFLEQCDSARSLPLPVLY